MKVISLNGRWQMMTLGGGGDAALKEPVSVRIPGSVYSGLLENGKMEDPFYRDNEYAARDISEQDFAFWRDFTVTKEQLSHRNVRLRFHGLDTLCDVYVNDLYIASCDNMHRTYEFDMKGVLREGTNTIRVEFQSPTRFIRKAHEERLIWTDASCTPGFNHLRKAHYMFRWDWGPNLPDMGIWRDVELVLFEGVRIGDSYVSQKHFEDGSVRVRVTTRLDRVSDEVCRVKTTLTAPDGETFTHVAQEYQRKYVSDILIENPQLWWCSGLGEQPLYQVDVSLLCGEEQIDEKSFRIGLRTLTMSLKEDDYGKDFSFCINGVSVFAMGANYIPEDNILARLSPERTRKLLMDCKRANYNCIRVWGGGFYPHDYFYDICDELGLMVWQDCMFACAVFEMTKPFVENITAEIIDNVKRLRHHASLALWCGNNEMESAFVAWNLPKDEKIRMDYLIQYESIIKDLVHEYDPDRFYWPSSPSSGGGFLDVYDEGKGDMHYWGVWHGNELFEAFRTHYYRFCSEFGFIAYPHMDTIESFTLPQDRNALSYVMESHQKCKYGNGKLIHYLTYYLRYPNSLPLLVYATQYLQGECIRIAVEHFRRHRGRCMGTTYWQVNDCWPTASWASIDSFGRWKGLHYFAKRFYAPVHLSAHEDRTQVTLSLQNETLQGFEGTVKYRLMKHDFTTLKSGSLKVSSPRMSAQDIITLDFSEELGTEGIPARTVAMNVWDTESTAPALRDTVLAFELYAKDGTLLEASSTLFCKAKHFDFLKPKYRVSVQEQPDRFLITVGSNVYAKGVEVDVKGLQFILSDNFFDLTSRKAVTLTLLKSDMDKEMSAEDIKKALTFQSLYDVQ